MLKDEDCFLMKMTLRSAQFRFAMCFAPANFFEQEKLGRPPKFSGVETSEGRVAGQIRVCLIQGQTEGVCFVARMV